MKLMMKVVIGVLILDWWSKWAVQNWWKWPVDWKLLEINLTRNEVLAWGIPVGGIWPMILAGVALGLVMGVVWREQGQMNHWEKWSWGLILGGGLGNFGERAGLGFVTDFIDLGWMPVFNLADIAITIGVGMLILGWIWEWKNGEKSTPQKEVD